MVKIINAGRAGRGLPKTSAGGRIIEIPPGQSIEFSQADWDAIKDRVSIKANIAEGSLKIDGGDAPAPTIEPVPVSAPEPEASAETVVKIVPKKAKKDAQ